MSGGEGGRDLPKLALRRPTGKTQQLGSESDFKWELGTGSLIEINEPVPNSHLKSDSDPFFLDDTAPAAGLDREHRLSAHRRAASQSDEAAPLRRVRRRGRAGDQCCRGRRVDDPLVRV